VKGRIQTCVLAAQCASSPHTLLPCAFYNRCLERGNELHCPHITAYAKLALTIFGLTHTVEASDLVAATNTLATGGWLHKQVHVCMPAVTVWAPLEHLASPVRLLLGTCARWCIPWSYCGNRDARTYLMAPACHQSICWQALPEPLGTCPQESTHIAAGALLQPLVNPLLTVCHLYLVPHQ
jgi:hypothetical protein